MSAAEHLLKPFWLCLCVYVHLLPVLCLEPMIAIYLHVAELGNMSITLRWSAFNYSMPITGYNVTVENTASVEDQTTYSVGGDQHELSISSLVYRNTYNFSLLAIDDSRTLHSASPITVVIRKCKCGPSTHA